MKIIVSNIQRFCTHDGPGIRTTVFFKGCTLKCPWCCNPENISFEIEDYLDNNLVKQYGKEYTLDELEYYILKDRIYYCDDGGVTFSGGECLWQFKKIEPLLKKLKKEGINICIETSLSTPSDFVEIALKYVDTFYIDVKILDKNKEYLINNNSDLFISNLKMILASKKKCIIRIPLVPDYTFTKDNIDCIIDFVKSNKINKIELFKIHRLGELKYRSLGLKMPYFKEINDDELIELKNKLEEYVKEVDVLKF